MIERKDVVGVYRQLGFEVLDASGKVIESDYNCASQIMYSPDGYLGVVSTPAGRKKTSAPAGRTDLAGATAEELAEATRGATCYAGHYELIGDTLHHHIEMALNPNLVGQTMIRHARLDRGDLTLTAPADAKGNVRRILWRRVQGN
jgi:hypothetical protein